MSNPTALIERRFSVRLQKIRRAGGGASRQMSRVSFIPASIAEPRGAGEAGWLARAYARAAELRGSRIARALGSHVSEGSADRYARRLTRRSREVQTSLVTRRLDYVKSAKQALAAGYLDRAAALCAQALDRSPTDKEALGVAGALATAREDWELALGHLDAVLAQDAKDPWAHLARARALLGLGRLEEARAALHRSRDLDPADPGLYEIEATILRGQGELEAALHACEGAIALDPHRVSAYSMRAELLDAMGRGDEALEVLRGAVRKLGRGAESHVAILEKLAALLDARGDHDEAAAARSLVAQLRPR
jgi:tetratricopeptide (TPR) repeat protein